MEGAKSGMNLTTRGLEPGHGWLADAAPELANLTLCLGQMPGSSCSEWLAHSWASEGQ